MGRGGPITWPPCLPDFTPVDKFLWGHIQTGCCVWLNIAPRAAAATVTPTLLQMCALNLNPDRTTAGLLLVPSLNICKPLQNPNHVTYQNIYCISLPIMYWAVFLSNHQHFVCLPRSWVLLEEVTGPQTVKKIPALHGTKRFITAVTGVYCLSLSHISSAEPLPRFPLHEGPFYPPIYS